MQTHADKPVLVVDDQSTARSILREMLQSLGYRVVEAADAEAAIEHIATQTFCLVTLDIILPQSSGLDVLRYARERFSYSELPIIVVSIKDQSEDIVEALSLGANDYVTKPIDHEVLTARINTHLSQWESEQRLRASRADLESRVAARTVDLELANRALRKEIEERRKAEQVLRKHEQMINSASDMLTFMDERYRYVAVNRTFLQTLGLGAEEVVGRSMADLFGEAFFAAELKSKIDLSLTGATVAAQLEIDLPARGRRHVDVRFDPHRDEGGEITGVVVSARDVTEKQQAENALHALARITAHKDTEAFLRTCITSLVNTYAVAYAYVSVFSDAVDELQTLAIWHGDRFVANVRYKLAGTPCADVIRHKSLFVERDVTKTYPEFADFQDWQVESYSGHAMLSQEGEPLGLVAVVHSKPIRVNAWTRSILETFAGRIALELERLRAERQLEDYRNNLEELVSSRTAELEAVNNEVASFSYSVSHDLRAPLRSIDGFSKLMLEDYGDKIDDNARVYLTRIRNASQHMGELIDDVLLLSRLSRRELSVQDLNLTPLAKEIFRKLEDGESERCAELVVPRNLPAKGDPHLLRILLENLLGNAWKYSRKQPSARIELNVQRDDDGQQVYYVRDNGVGFDMKYVDKLFQPFQRLHSVTEFEGTGIGLATVAQIVRRHSGEVWAKSELNFGATVYFTLSSRQN